VFVICNRAAGTPLGNVLTTVLANPNIVASGKLSFDYYLYFLILKLFVLGIVVAFSLLVDCVRLYNNTISRAEFVENQIANSVSAAAGTATSAYIATLVATSSALGMK
jgi:hypothetical protein